MTQKEKKGKKQKAKCYMRDAGFEPTTLRSLQKRNWNLTRYRCASPPIVEKAMKLLNLYSSRILWSRFYFVPIQGAFRFSIHQTVFIISYFGSSELGRVSSTILHNSSESLLFFFCCIQSFTATHTTAVAQKLNVCLGLLMHRTGETEPPKCQNHGSQHAYRNQTPKKNFKDKKKSA